MTDRTVYTMSPVHALRVARRMLGEQRRREMVRFERGIGMKAQANLLQRVSDIDEVVAALTILEARIDDTGV